MRNADRVQYCRSIRRWLIKQLPFQQRYLDHFLPRPRVPAEVVHHSPQLLLKRAVERARKPDPCIAEEAVRKSHYATPAKRALVNMPLKFAERFSAASS